MLSMVLPWAAPGNPARNQSKAKGTQMTTETENYTRTRGAIAGRIQRREPISNFLLRQAAIHDIDVTAMVKVAILTGDHSPASTEYRCADCGSLAVEQLMPAWVSTDPHEPPVVDSEAEPLAYRCECGCESVIAPSGYVTFGRWGA